MWVFVSIFWLRAGNVLVPVVQACYLLDLTLETCKLLWSFFLQLFGAIYRPLTSEGTMNCCPGPSLCSFLDIVAWRTLYKHLKGSEKNQ